MVFEGDNDETRCRCRRGGAQHVHGERCACPMGGSERTISLRGKLPWARFRVYHDARLGHEFGQRGWVSVARLGGLSRPSVGPKLARRGILFARWADRSVRQWQRLAPNHSGAGGAEESPLLTRRRIYQAT